MFPRHLPRPDHSFFLFGPRGTGKTTWLKERCKGAKWFDLVRNAELLALMRDPDLFRRVVEALPAGSWVVVDEVQKLPSLLNEVHGLIADHGKRYRFALSGSSARKLKRLDANLLAGRVINRTFFPLTTAEIGGKIDVEELLSHGCLPNVRSEPEHAIDVLEAYVANYVKEEIQQEALVANVESFSRFLEVAAIMNAQVMNVVGIARDCAVARPTVQRYFDTLVDTLLGVMLPAWRPRAKVKEVSHPKFYFFDPGVVRGITQRLRDPIESEERGRLLETLVLHELRAHIAIANVGGTLSYWRTPSGSEVDFIWSRGKKAIGIEVKAARSWRPEFGAALRDLARSKTIAKGFGIYLGRDALREDQVDVLPFAEFARRLHRGEVVG